MRYGYEDDEEIPEDDGGLTEEDHKSVREAEAQNAKEGELRDGILAPRAPRSPEELLKERVVELFDIQPELLDGWKMREREVLDPNEVPTRREIMGYKWIPTEEERKSKVSQKFREVPCPACQGIMTVLKSKTDKKFGETITYQCHNVNEFREMCLMVVAITTSVWHM